MIYLVKAARSGKIKIGYTAQLDKRISALKSQYKDDLKLLKTFPGGRKTEKWLHQFFKDNALGNEWFLFDESMLTITPPDFYEFDIENKNLSRLGSIYVNEKSFIKLKKIAAKEQRTASRQAAYVLEKMG